jgi:hypothetical protein
LRGWSHDRATTTTDVANPIRLARHLRCWSWNLLDGILFPAASILQCECTLTAELGPIGDDVRATVVSTVLGDGEVLTGLDAGDASDVNTSEAGAPIVSIGHATE